MSTVITRQYEHWCANQLISNEPARPDTFIFACIPDMDISAPISVDEELPDEKYIVCRVPVTQFGMLEPDTVAFSVILDTTAGDFEYNWIGLYHEESHVLCMIAHTPLQQKIRTANGIQGNNLIRTFAMEFEGAAEAMQVNVTADVWQIDFTARLTGMDESRRLLAFDYYGDAACLGNSLHVSYDAINSTATISAGVAYIGGLRVQLTEPFTLTASENDIILIDASWQGHVSGCWKTVFVFTARQPDAGNTNTRPVTEEYTDNNGFRHYVAPLAVLSAGHVEDVRPQTPDEENSDALAAHVRSRNHPDATLDEKGFAQYCSDTDSDREDRAATPKAVKNAMDEAKRRVPSTRKVNGKELSEDITITDISGNSGTATKLKTSRKIGGVSFDGSGDISLPGVNTQGNQNTTGNAGSATKLQNARKINGVAFDGTKDITISAGMTQAAADARYVQNEQYTNETFHNPGGNEISWTFRAPAGCVLSGINVQETGSHSADNIGGVYYKAKQIYINGAWRTISG